MQESQSQSEGTGATAAVTPMFLVQLLLSMWEQRIADMVHPLSRWPVASGEQDARADAGGCQVSALEEDCKYLQSLQDRAATARAWP